MTPEQIKQARLTLGLTQKEFMQTFFGSGDTARFRQYELGARSMPAPAAMMIEEALNGVPQWTVSEDVDLDNIWVCHNRWPRMMFQIVFNDDGSRDITPTSAPPEKLDQHDMWAMMRKADAVYCAWHDS